MYYYLYPIKKTQPGVEMHTFDCNTREAQAGRVVYIVSSMTARATQSDPGERERGRREQRRSTPELF